MRQHNANILNAAILASLHFGRLSANSTLRSLLSLSRSLYALSRSCVSLSINTWRTKTSVAERMPLEVSLISSSNDHRLDGLGYLRQLRLDRLNRCTNISLASRVVGSRVGRDRRGHESLAESTISGQSNERVRSNGRGLTDGDSESTRNH